MTIKAVTTAQLEQVRKMAGEKGVGKDEFQQALDNGAVAVMLDRMKARSEELPMGLLTEIAIVQVPAVEKFVAADHFGDGNPAGIKFWLGDDFQRNFLGKVEENVPEAMLAIHRLTKSSLDDPIRKELGAEHEETMLAHLYELLKRQPRGESGPLLVNGYTKNIFYVRDTNGNLWAVLANWFSIHRVWDVIARSVESPFERDVGYQVFSRK